MKIPFDIKFRPQIESGEYKVETGDKKRVRIICWNRKVNDFPIVALAYDAQRDIEIFINASVLGEPKTDTASERLFIVTPEEELTPLEDCLSTYLKNDFEYFSTKKWDEKKWNKTMRIQAAELLKLAREQFIKDGYVIEKKAFHDAVENIDDTYKTEMSVEYSLHCKVENGTRHAIMNWNEFQKVAQHFINCGIVEAFKDLPRWNKSRSVYRDGLINDGFLYYKNHSIQLSSLEKLPGFNE